MSSLAGKVALVTGASRGIGRGIALQLGGAGAKVYITGRKPAASEGSKYADLPTLENTAQGSSKEQPFVAHLMPFILDEQTFMMFQRLNLVEVVL